MWRTLHFHSQYKTQGIHGEGHQPHTDPLWNPDAIPAISPNGWTGLDGVSSGDPSQFRPLVQASPVSPT